ncbi:MAG: S8 family serine peptidase [Akkermansiaceae bacterium]
MSDFQVIKRSLRVAFVCVISSATILADWRDDVGFTRLQSTVGGDLPTTVGDGFTQVEAQDTASNYMPNTLQAIFQGKTFVNKTNTSPTTSNHANNVATFFYSTSSLLPGTSATTVDVYSADHWLNAGFLKTGTTNEPAIESRAIQNHSWIATSGDTVVFEEVNQRLDYAIDRDGFVSVVGENNGSSTALPLLLGQGYHTIAVGRTDGLHSYSTTTIDGIGRIKPDLVAPGSATSYSTPMVSSAAGILYQKLQASPYSLTGADLPRTIKAMLMASARKDTVSGWNNTTPRPLDEIY